MPRMVVAAAVSALVLLLAACDDGSSGESAVADPTQEVGASATPAEVGPDEEAAPVEDERPAPPTGDGGAVASPPGAPSVEDGGTLEDLCDRAVRLRRQGEEIGEEIGLEDMDAFMEAVNEANIAAFSEAPAEYRDDVQRVINYLVAVSPYVGDLIELQVSGGSEEDARRLTRQVAEVQQEHEGLFTSVERIESACEDEAGTVVYLEIYPV
jgi:hypothetical protein